MSHAELAKLLRRLPIFSALEAEEAVLVASRCTGLKYQPGMRIFSEGEFADSVMIVVSGAVQVGVCVADGPDLVIATVSPGGILGEMALIDPAPRAATATAITETVVLVIDAHAFSDLLAAGHPAASGVLRTISLQVCSRMRAVEAKLDGLLSTDPDSARRELADVRWRLNQ